MAGRPKKVMSLKELLEYRISNNKNKTNKKGKAKEFDFTKELYGELENILTELGYKVKKITKEYRLLKGICDFICELENEEYLIIECKVTTDTKYESNDLRFAFAIGQLLTYRTSFSLEYEIPKNKIKLMLATNEDSLFTLSVISSENLNINYLVYNNGEVKYYGQ